MPTDGTSHGRVKASEKALIWAFAAVAILANAAGYLLDLWSRIRWYDEVVHFYATFALTLVLGVYLYGVVLTGARTSPVRLAVVVAGIGLAAGGLWEIAEWVYDQWFAAGDAILGKRDTMFDLVLDAGGALIAGVLTVRMVRD